MYIYIYIYCVMYIITYVYIYIYVDHFTTKSKIVTSPGFCLRPLGGFGGTPRIVKNDIVRTLGNPEIGLSENVGYIPTEIAI